MLFVLEMLLFAPWLGDCITDRSDAMLGTRIECDLRDMSGRKLTPGSEGSDLDG